MKPFTEVSNKFVLRMQVENRPGVLAGIAGVFGAHQVSISKVVQKIIADGAAELVIVTEKVKERAFQDALERLKDLEAVRELSSVIREARKQTYRRCPDERTDVHRSDAQADQ